VSEQSTTRRSTPPGWPCALAAAPELAVGTIVGAGRFVVGGMLGRGGMATVYRGYDRRLGCDVALKVMLGDLARHRARARRFEHEAGLLARLPAHPGLVRLIHAGCLPEWAERPFLAVELIEGPILAFRLAAELRMPTQHAVALGLGLAEALVAVHGVGLVHRDLTARNVMLRHADEGMQPIIVDFGVAAALEPEPGATRLTRPDQRPGTITAMAPEQYRGRPAHPAMDVYALGRLLYEMLTGEDPHALVSHAQLLACHQEGARVAPRLAGRDDVGPAELRVLVDACLDPEAARRPTAGVAAAELRAVGRALERGATVLPFVHAGERSVVAVPRVSVAAARARSRRGGWWIVGMGLGVAGVVLAMPGEVALPIEWRAEPAAVAWPATVVPLARPKRSRAPASRDASGAEAPRRAAAASARAVPRGPLPPAPLPPACHEQRERAHAAARRWAWPEVLDATAEATCWLDAGERTRLRLVAWIEQQRFDACVEEGAEVHDPMLVRLVERCRQRHAPSRAGAGGPP
jgi:eukaryotic-like serine/threonine-protein kinase